MTVSEKHCGACSVCCKELMFDIAATRILAGVMCPHAAPPSGCTIHQTRPQVCRAYFCGWHHLPSLGEEWRPDQSELLISFREGPAPDGLMDGVEFELVGARDRIFWPPLVAYIATLIVDNDPVYLSIPGDVGFQSPWVYLNNIPALQQAIAERHFAKTATALSQALQVCIDYPKTKLPEAEN
jgi:hypothetical protein